MSFGVGCARPRVAGVYSSIAANRPWIEMFLEECKQFYCKQGNSYDLIRKPVVIVIS